MEWIGKARSCYFGPSFFDYRIVPEATRADFINLFPANCKAGIMCGVLLKEIRCKCKFYVCRSCWRGQVYCTKSCRKICQREMHREAQRKYRHTEKGKETRRLYEKTKNTQKNRGNPGDDSATPPKSCDMEPEKRSGNRPRCAFCGSIGVVVDHFPRRAYGGKVFSEGSGFERGPYP